MAKRMLIDATHPEETRVVILSGSRLEEFDFETSTKKQVKGNIYLAKVTRVEPSLQAAFVEYGGNRHGFLAFSEIHPDYYRIPVADREALLAEHAAEDDDDEEFEAEPRRRSRRPRRGGRGDQGREAEAHAQDGERPEGQAYSEGHAYSEDGESSEGESADDRGDHGQSDEGGSDAAAWDHRPVSGEGDRPPDVAPASGAASQGWPVAHEPAAHEDAAHEDAAGTRGNGADAGSDGDAPTAVPPRPAIATDEGLYVASLRSEPVTGEAGTADAAGDHAPEVDRESHEGDGGEPAPAQTAEEEAERVEAAAAIETLGGDELEDVRRRRQRSTRQYKIQEVVKRRQILLVQVTKEERGNKGAALTTYLSLAGRYCVLMPNAGRSGGGVSRKIVNPVDRRRLKSLIEEMQLPDGMSVIVRTAGSERSRAEIKRDLEYLLRLWDEIRELTMQSTAPALVYEEGKLIKRAIRDVYSRDIDEILVEGEDAYREAKDFMRMLMPSHAKRVQPYRDPGVPLFNRFQIDQQIDAIHSPVVQLKSGGYIVINPTEALVAIDVNSGRSTRERNIEETAYRTNLEAADEIARQLRLRDLAGLIVIDFIDMEEGRNQHAVERRLKEAMKADRARIQIGRISPFGLLELSRQRLRPSFLETSTQPCPHCGATGHIRSTESTALHVLRAIEEEGLRRRSAEIRITVPTSVALYILNQKRATLSDIERRYAFEVFIDRDDELIPPDYRLERLRVRPASEAPPLPAPLPIEPEDDDLDIVEDDADADEDEAEDAVAEAGIPAPEGGEPTGEEDEEGRPRRRRRRRRRDDRREGDERREGEEHHEGDERPAAEGGEAAVPLAAEGDAATDAATDSNGEGDEDDEGAEAGPDASGPDSGGDDEDQQARRRRRRGRRGGRRRTRREDESLPGSEQAPAEAGSEDASPPPAAVPVEPPPPPRPVIYPSLNTRDAVEALFEALEVDQERPKPRPSPADAAEASTASAAMADVAATETPAQPVEATPPEAQLVEAQPVEAERVEAQPVEAQPVAEMVQPVAPAAVEPAAPEAPPAVVVERAPEPAPAEPAPVAASPREATPEAAPAPEPTPASEPAVAPEPAPVPEPVMAEPEPQRSPRKGWWQRLVETR